MTKKSVLECFFEKCQKVDPPKIGHFRGGGLLSDIFSKKHSKTDFLVINLIFLQKMAIFWPKKWSQGPEKKKKIFFIFLFVKPQDEKNPPFIFLIFFFLPIFWRKMSVFSRFFGQKSPLGPFHEYPPGPTGVPYRFKPKKWSKMTKKILCPQNGGFNTQCIVIKGLSWGAEVYSKARVNIFMC